MSLKPKKSSKNYNYAPLTQAPMPTGVPSHIGGTGQTKSKFLKELSKMMPLLSSREEIEMLLKVNERYFNMILEKCVDKDITISEWLKTDDAKSYKYLYHKD